MAIIGMAIPGLCIVWPRKRVKFLVKTPSFMDNASSRSKGSSRDELRIAFGAGSFVLGL